MSTTRKKTPTVGRGIALTLGAGLALLLVLGLVLSAAYGSQRITSSATSLHAADEILRSATVARAQLAIAVYTTQVDTAFGTNSSEVRELSIGEAQQAIILAETRFTVLAARIPANERLDGAVRRFISTGDELATALEAGEWKRDGGLDGKEFEVGFKELTEELVAVRNRLAATVAESDRMLGLIGTAGRFLVAFLVPVAIILLYRELARRQQRQTELERRLAAERTLASSREKFIANASHELRTPLTGILGMALLLEEEPAIQGSEIANELLSMVISEAHDLTRMVDDLLTTARMDSGALHFAFEDCNIATATEEAVESLTRVGLDVMIDVEPGMVRADQLRLRQVLRNLLSNAKKYGGPNIRVEGRVQGATYEWSVVDDGDGVTEAVLTRLFQPFVHRGEDVAVTASVGLGLSIVHAIALGMGGDVVHRRIDDKTYFTVRLPLTSGLHVAQDAFHLPPDALESELHGSR